MNLQQTLINFEKIIFSFQFPQACPNKIFQNFIILILDIRYSYFKAIYFTKESFYYFLKTNDIFGYISLILISLSFFYSFIKPPIRYISFNFMPRTIWPLIIHCALVQLNMKLLERVKKQMQ